MYAAILPFGVNGKFNITGREVLPHREVRMLAGRLVSSVTWWRVGNTIWSSTH